jgi:hypothetical protein
MEARTPSRAALAATGPISPPQRPMAPQEQRQQQPQRQIVPRRPFVFGGRRSPGGRRVLASPPRPPPQPAALQYPAANGLSPARELAAMPLAAPDAPRPASTLVVWVLGCRDCGAQLSQRAVRAPRLGTQASGTNSEAMYSTDLPPMHSVGLFGPERAAAGCACRVRHAACICWCVASAFLSFIHTVY